MPPSPHGISLLKRTLFFIINGRNLILALGLYIIGILATLNIEGFSNFSNFSTIKTLITILPSIVAVILAILYVYIKNLEKRIGG